MAGEEPSKKAEKTEREARASAPAAEEPSSVRASERAGSSARLRVSESEIMTRAEVAKLLRCSEPHVIALIEREGLPAFRLGKLWRFSRSEVIAWCERRTNGRRTA